MAGWLDSYRAAKAGVPPTYQGTPAPQYQQPVGPPAHAPFGYDPNTGVPVAPYGRDQSGNIIVPQQQTVAFDQRGLPIPQGYGQAPYGQVPGQYPQQQFQQPDSGPTILDAQGHVHYMDAAAHFRGTKQAQEAAQECPHCTLPNGKPGVMLRRTTSAVMNTNTGQMVEPAPICTNCGYNGKWEQSGSGSGMDGMVTNVDQARHYGRGGANETQAAHIHGMRNLFAKDNPQRGRRR